jgi:hypothetical protein
MTDAAKEKQGILPQDKLVVFERKFRVFWQEPHPI